MTMSTTIASRKYYRIIALLCTLLVFVATAKVRAAKVSRPEEALPISQCDAEVIAAVGHPFVLQNYATASYLSPPGREIRKQSPTTFSLTYRGPPALF